MKDARGAQVWTLAGVVALALTVGTISMRSLARHEARAAAAVDEGLRDAVAETPATAGLAGKPVPTSWFKTPETRRAEMDAALFASRRRRAVARRVAVQ